MAEHMDCLLVQLWSHTDKVSVLGVLSLQEGTVGVWPVFDVVCVEREGRLLEVRGLQLSIQRSARL